MIILPQTIEVTWNNANIAHYQSKGYTYTRNKERFIVNVLDLPITSSKKVRCTCDYCGSNFETLYRLVSPYRKIKYRSELKNVCGVNSPCFTEKVKEICLEKYGVRSPLCLDEIKEKSKQTCIIKYGSENVSSLTESKEKTKQTCLKKYGVSSPMQNKLIKEKSKRTILENYGVTNVFQSDKIKEQITQTNLKNIGVEYPMQSKSIREKSKQTLIKRYGVDNASHINTEERISKARNTLSKNGNGPCSKQQRYLHSLLGGNLNYLIGWFLLDIAFPDERVYIEYDGGGHNYAIKAGAAKTVFLKKEIIRRKVLLNKGWKLIRYITSKDLLLRDEKIIELVEKCKNYLRTTNHSWIEINMDSNKIKCSEYEIDIGI